MAELNAKMENEMITINTTAAELLQRGAIYLRDFEETGATSAELDTFESELVAASSPFFDFRYTIGNSEECLRFKQMAYQVFAINEKREMETVATFRILIGEGIEFSIYSTRSFVDETLAKKIFRSMPADTLGSIFKQARAEFNVQRDLIGVPH